MPNQGHSAWCLRNPPQLSGPRVSSSNGSKASDSRGNEVSELPAASAWRRASCTCTAPQFRMAGGCVCHVTSHRTEVARCDYSEYPYRHASCTCTAPQFIMADGCVCHVTSHWTEVARCAYSEYPCRHAACMHTPMSVHTPLRPFWTNNRRRAEPGARRARGAARTRCHVWRAAAAAFRPHSENTRPYRPASARSPAA